MQEAAFAIADVVMVCVGVSTLANLKKWDWKSIVEWIPALSCTAVAVLFTNVVLGVATGMALYTVLALVLGKKTGYKVGVENIVLLAVLAVSLGMSFVA
jgi:xanthine/uracil/vitamin C permease (AzgA family)